MKLLFTWLFFLMGFLFDSNLLCAQTPHKGTRYSYVDANENRIEVTVKKDSYWVMYLPQLKQDDDGEFSTVKPYRYQVTLEEYDQLLVLFDAAIDAKKEHGKKDEKGCYTLYFMEGKDIKYKIKPAAKSKMAIDKKLEGLKEKYKDKLVMIETKLTYTYLDGSGNTYVLTNQFQKCKIVYKPITPEMSSSGTYSGGDPYENRILFEEYLELGSLLETAFSSTDQHTTSRTKGTALITLEGSAGRSCLLEMNADIKKQIELKFQQLKKRYIELDSELAIKIKGKVVERAFESKKGTMTNIKEYYFVPNAEEVKNRQLENEYFIKLSKGKVTKDELKKIIDQEKLFGLTSLWGLWDADDNTHQSRVGNYVVLFSIE